MKKEAENMIEKEKWNKNVERETQKDREEEK